MGGLQGHKPLAAAERGLDNWIGLSDNARQEQQYGINRNQTRRKYQDFIDTSVKG
jgi:hypothetical protein